MSDAEILVLALVGIPFAMVLVLFISGVMVRGIWEQDYRGLYGEWPDDEKDDAK